MAGVNENEQAEMEKEEEEGQCAAGSGHAEERSAKLTEYQEKKAQIIARLKWKAIRDPVLPPPQEYEPITYKISQALRERFRDSGLQVIVKMASIELTPEKADFPAGGWHASTARRVRR